MPLLELTLYPTDKIISRLYIFGFLPPELLSEKPTEVLSNSLLIPVFVSILNLNYLLYHQNLCFSIHDKKKTGNSALTKSPAINLIYFFTHLHAVLGIDFIQTYPNNSFAAFSSSLLSCVLSYPPFRSSIPLIRFKENNPLRLQ